MTIEETFASLEDTISVLENKETTLEDTVEAALEQIEEKKYDAELIKRGVKEENIHHYGFAFKGKEVLIDGR